MAACAIGIQLVVSARRRLYAKDGEGELASPAHNALTDAEMLTSIL
eukprot:gene12869-67138_t